MIRTWFTVIGLQLLSRHAPSGNLGHRFRCGFLIWWRRLSHLLHRHLLGQLDVLNAQVGAIGQLGIAIGLNQLIPGQS